MSDLPLQLDSRLADRLARVADLEGKIPRALDALGPVHDRDVVILDGPHELRSRQLSDRGARVLPPDVSGPETADVAVAFWTAFRGVDAAELADADRRLRPGGRLLVVHDYGRDDLSRLRGDDLPEYGSWGRRDGPFLRGGFRIRVVHCWWTFGDLDEARDILGQAFGPQGEAFASGLKRPRLSWNVAVYHRTRGDTSVATGPAAIASA